jgi:hypothetical protein
MHGIELVDPHSYCFIYCSHKNFFVFFIVVFHFIHFSTKINSPWRRSKLKLGPDPVLAYLKETKKG